MVGTTRTGPTSVLAAALLALVIVLLTACGAPATQMTAGAPAPGAAPAAAPAGAAGAPAARAPDDGLPTLPPVATRQPERFDAAGCLRTSATTSDCMQRSAQLDAEAAGHGPQDWRTLAGFVGKQYASDLSRDATVVLTDTVTTTPPGAGLWAAQGLVGNEHRRTLAGVSVEATLLDAGGAVLEIVTAPSAVTAIRAGEPVPFRVQATRPTTTAAAVASVRWRTIEDTPTAAGSVPASPDRSTRELEITTYWTRPYGDERAVQMYLHHDDGGAPAYLLFGSVLAHAGVVRPHVVLAWMDTAGRVVAVRDVDVADPSGAPAASLSAGAARDFLVAIDDPVDGTSASDSAPMQWAGGR